MARKFDPVFTLPGLAVFLVSFVILVRSLIARNAYEILLSSAALFLWFILFFAGKWGLRKLIALEPLLKPPLPLAASSKEDWIVTVSPVKVPRFFRLHFYIRGRFYPQGQEYGRLAKQGVGCPVFAETSLSRKGDTSGLSLSFPLGGLFRGSDSCRLRDIFGFFSFPCGLIREQTLKIRNAPCTVRALRIDARSGAEDRRNKSSTDEERYYMREYAPGDRFRDINWKSSERIDTLITRISPDNQDKVTRIEIHFRNYGPSRPSLNELWLLDRSKARLAWFLRSVKEEKASYIFHVCAGGGEWELNNQDQIESFLDELAALPFSPHQNEDSDSPGAEGKTGELYVFSTACDAGLPAFLLARQASPVSLFMAQNAPKGQTAGENECLYLRDFIAGGSVPLLRWFLRPDKRQGIKHGVRAITDYAETRL